MIPIEAFSWALAGLWGFALGLFYFGGLWWTLRRLPARSRQKAWLALSYIVRLTLTMLGLWLILRWDLVAFFFTIGAFFLTRFLLINKLGARERREHGTQP